MDFKAILFAVLILAALGVILGILIAIISKVFHVEEDTRLEQILPLLPGANCGGCGYPGCSGLADAIVHEGVNPRQCKPIKQDKIDQINLLMEKFKELEKQAEKQ